MVEKPQMCQVQRTTTSGFLDTDWIQGGCGTRISPKKGNSKIRRKDLINLHIDRLGKRISLFFTGLEKFSKLFSRANKSTSTNRNLRNGISRRQIGVDVLSGRHRSRLILKKFFKNNYEYEKRQILEVASNLLNC